MTVLDHLEQAQTGVAGSVRQVAMGEAVEMPYFSLFIDENDTGAKML